MAEGSGTNNGTYKLILTVNQQSQDISKNTSTVKWTLELKSTGSYSFATWGSTCKVYIDGAEVYNAWSQKSISAGGSIIIASGTRTITHNSDGKKSISYNAEYNEGSTKYYTPGYISCSGNLSLDTIPRASKPSLITYPESTRNFNIGESIIIHCNRKSTNFKHTAWLNYGSSKIKIAENITDNFKFDTSKYLDTFYKYIPNNTQGVGNISLDTYNGDQLIGTDSVEFIANVPIDIVPTIDSVQIDEADENIKSNFDIFIKDVSKLKIKVNASGINYSTIKSYKIEVNGAIYNTKEAETDVIRKSGENEIKITITDSRGRETSTINKINVMNYFLPFFGDGVVDRTDSMGFSSEDGTNISTVIDVNYCLLNGENVVWSQLSYKKKNEIKYTDLEPQILDSGRNLNENILQLYYKIKDIDVDSSYDVKVTIYDSICEYKNISIKKIWEVSTGYTTLDYLTGGKGVAIGKVAEKEGLEIALVTTFLRGINCIEVDAGDANDYMLAGFYHFSENNLNIPLNEKNFMLIIGNKSECIQISIITKTAEIYVRSFQTNSWSNWRSL